MPAVPPQPKGRSPSGLHWFPFYVKDFLASPSVRRMTDADVGRYVLLLCTAWDDGTREPTLTKADLRGASKLVREMFTPHGDGYVQARQLDVWREQQGRHVKAVERARKAGRASGQRRANNKRTPSSLEANHSSMSMDLDSPKDYLPRGAGAPALSGAAPAPSVEDTDNGAMRDVRSGGGPTSLLDVMRRVVPGLVPEPAR